MNRRAAATSSSASVEVTPASGGTLTETCVVAKATTGSPSSMASISDNPSEVHRIRCT